MIGFRNGGFFGAGDISCHTDKPAEVTKFQGKVTFPACPSPGFPDNFLYGTLVKVRDMPVPDNFLGYEADQFLPVLSGVFHGLPHVDFVPVTFYPGTKSRVHFLNRIKVSCRDHDEVTGHGFGLNKGSGTPFGLPGNRVLLFLQRGQQALLGFKPEGVDFVDEKHPFMAFVDVAGFHTVVGRGLKPSGLEGVVPDIAEESPCVGSG